MLSIPAVSGDVDIIGAAFAYANAGWYVGPTKHGDKSPGGVLGKGWQHQTSRDPEQIVAWFAGTDYGLFLHVGRSGAVVFDVDDYSRLPELLRKAFGESGAPFQSTRANDPNRGHYVFTVPDGRVLGNGVGRIGGGWGEIRGANGVIVAAPSTHEKPEGQYVWLSWGVVPVLPDYVAVCLDDASPAVDAATDAAVEAFLANHASGDRLDVLQGLLGAFRKAVGEGESRHHTAVRIACAIARDAANGRYPASVGRDMLASAFVASVAVDGHGQQGTARTVPLARSEFSGIWSWATAQALARPEQTPEQASERSLTFNPMDGEVPKVMESSVVEFHTPDSPPEVHAAKVLAELERLRVRAEAAQWHAAEQHSALWTPPTDLGVLTKELMLPDAGPEWRIRGLLGAGHNAILVAGRKAGKTTMINELTRSLVDGDPFLGKFEVEGPSPKVAIFNYEVDERQYRRWLRKHGIVNTDNVYVLHLRGKRLPMSNAHVRQWVTDWLAEREINVWIVDPYSRAYVGSVDNGNDEAKVGAFLDLLDTVKADAGVSELVMPVHTPKGRAEDGEETAIGSQRLEAWPDGLWYLVRDVVTKLRFMRAEGRDVDVNQEQVTYSPETHRLAFGGWDRATAVRNADRDKLVTVIAANPGISQNKIMSMLGWGQQRVKKAIASAIDRIDLIEGSNRTVKHFIREERQKSA